MLLVFCGHFIPDDWGTGLRRPTHHDSFLQRFFSFTPFVWLGRVSYGVYPFHFTIFQWIQHERWASLPKELVVEYALTAVAVFISCTFVERLALKLKHRLRRTPRLTAALKPLTEVG